MKGPRRLPLDFESQIRVDEQVALRNQRIAQTVQQLLVAVH